MRLDHLLSKDRSKGYISVGFSYEGNKRVSRKDWNILKVLSGGDACGGNTRSHPEHDGEDPCGRWYYAGDGMGEQAAARHFIYAHERVRYIAAPQHAFGASQTFTCL